MKAFRILSASLWLAACASEVSPEEIERAEQQPYDDEPQVAVTAQPLGAAQAIAEMCKARCGSVLAMGTSIDAAVVTEENGDTIKRAIISSGQTTSKDTNQSIRQLTEASDLTLYYSFVEAGANHRVSRIDAGGQTWIFDAVGAIRDLMVDATNLYFIDDNGLRKRPRSGGLKKTIVPAADVGALLGIDGTKLYFTNKARTQLRRVDVDGANNTLVKSGFVSAFAQDSSFLYVYYDQEVTVIQKAEPFLSWYFRVLLNHPSNFVAKDGSLYFLDTAQAAPPFTSVLKRVSATGGRAGTLYEGALMMSLKIVGNSIYWLEQPTVDEAMTLMRAAL